MSGAERIVREQRLVCEAVLAGLEGEDLYHRVLAVTSVGVQAMFYAGTTPEKISYFVGRIVQLSQEQVDAEIDEATQGALRGSRAPLPFETDAHLAARLQGRVDELEAKVREHEAAQAERASRAAAAAAAAAKLRAIALKLDDVGFAVVASDTISDEERAEMVMRAAVRLAFRDGWSIEELSSRFDAMIDEEADMVPPGKLHVETEAAGGPDAS